MGMMEKTTQIKFGEILDLSSDCCEPNQFHVFGWITDIKQIQWTIMDRQIHEDVMNTPENFDYKFEYYWGHKIPSEKWSDYYWTLITRNQDWTSKNKQGWFKYTIIFTKPKAKVQTEIKTIQESYIDAPTIRIEKCCKCGFEIKIKNGFDAANPYSPVFTDNCYYHTFCYTKANWDRKDSFDHWITNFPTSYGQLWQDFAKMLASQVKK